MIGQCILRILQVMTLLSADRFKAKKILGLAQTQVHSILWDLPFMRLDIIIF